MDVLILYGIGLITDVEQAARHLAGGGGLVEAGQQDAELIAVPARDRVMGARGEAQTLGDFHQQGVTDRVAVTTVDVFEAIEVEKQHRQQVAVAACRRDRLGESIGEQLTVGQMGQRIMGRLMGELAGERQIFCDVMKGDDGTLLRAVFSDYRAGGNAHRVAVAQALIKQRIGRRTH